MIRLRRKWHGDTADHALCCELAMLVYVERGLDTLASEAWSHCPHVEHYAKLDAQPKEER